MLSWFFSEFGLWSLAVLAGVACVVMVRLDSRRAGTVLGWSSFGCFVAGALFWMFGDTYRYYFTEKEAYLRISYWGSFYEDQTWKEIVAGFQERYPDIPVKCEYFTGGRYDEKIQQLLLANEAPDVMQFEEEPLPRFVQSGKFEVLDDYCNTTGLEINLDRDFWATAVECHQYKGKTYGIPMWGGNCLIVYNREMFRRANVPEPHDHWTMEEFLDTAKKLTIDLDGDGHLDYHGFWLPTWIYWQPFHYAFGATYLDPTRTTWTLWGPEAQASYTFWQDLSWRHNVAPRRIELEMLSASMPFMTGSVAMFVTGPWTMLRLNAAGMDYDIAPIPYGPAGRATRVTWNGLVMFAGSEKKDWAWKFIHYATSSAAQDLVARSGGSIPALKASSKTFIQANKGVKARLWIEALEYSRIQPITVYWELMHRELKGETDAMNSGSQTPAETIRRLAANPQLSKCFIMPKLQVQETQR